MKIRAGLLLIAAAFVGCGYETSQTIPNPSASTPDVQTAELNSADGSAEANFQTVALKVPSMHCPFACWPKVRDTLKEQGGVADVELAPQADPNAIDNPVVYVKLNGDFEQAQAFAALASAGFDDAEVAATP
ncbi:MAG: heavy-metal-associated domain-containing protein [Pirellulaceae bacterium]|nr:hypothetical protein [Planctomycetales bacterium]MCA9162678.1 hypothetical protein [Planctomycetales bacterium]MCA9202996.1 hypothetical protein [Planctomycetales bacterium]MCA9207102.1 hypothetical protein [Planctomycetales bacterium]MCA9222202.1 hypothetical protein [Planctomycetales bacterium]